MASGPQPAWRGVDLGEVVDVADQIGVSVNCASAPAFTCVNTSAACDTELRPSAGALQQFWQRPSVAAIGSVDYCGCSGRGPVGIMMC
jgi:hypothetical protein